MSAPPGPAGRMRSEDRPDGGLAWPGDGEESLGPFDRLVLVASLHQCPAADQFLRLGERAVQDRVVRAVVLDPGGVLQRANTSGGDENPGLRGLFDECAHLGEHLRARRRDRNGRIGEGVAKETHGVLLCSRTGHGSGPAPAAGSVTRHSCCSARASSDGPPDRQTSKRFSSQNKAHPLTCPDTPVLSHRRGFGRLADPASSLATACGKIALVNFAIAATTLAVVLSAELPDKSALASLMLGSRYRPIYVFAGVAAAFAVHVVLALVAGGLLALLPHRVLSAIVAVLFGAGAVLLVFGRREDDTVDKAAAETPPTFVRVAATSFIVVFLGEFGD